MRRNSQNKGNPSLICSWRVYWMSVGLRHIYEKFYEELVKISKVKYLVLNSLKGLTTYNVRGMLPIFFQTSHTWPLYSEEDFIKYFICAYVFILIFKPQLSFSTSNRWHYRDSFSLSWGELIYIPFTPGSIAWPKNLPGHATAMWVGEGMALNCCLDIVVMFSDHSWKLTAYTFILLPLS